MRRLIIFLPAFAILAVAVLAVACSPAAAPAAEPPAAAIIDDVAAINQLQSFGTHNSYKVAIPQNELDLIAARNPDAAITLDYNHRSIAEQLTKGARQLELDPSDDPEGGLFATPLARKLLEAQGVTPDPYDLAAMSQPGIKVIHVADIDYRSHCLLFVDCLKQVKAWSDANPTHTPILIMINPKSSGIAWDGAAKVLPWGKDAYNRMDAEIRSVFSDDQMITPDDVRGSHATLREAVLAGGWPKLGQARGKVIFTIDLSPEATAPYAEGHPSLEGRVAFMTTYPDAPEAAYFTMNDPEAQLAEIQERVRQGFLIRTRADADTREARTGATGRREAALASGAQFISTDYMWPDTRFSDYTATLPDGAITRCNPVNAPEGCTGKAE
jgi:hypothetical protein